MMDTKRSFQVFFLIAALEAIFCVAWLGLMPAESASAVLFGYSIQRLILMTAMLLAAGAAVGGYFFSNKFSQKFLNFEKLITNRWTWLPSFAFCSAAWIAWFLPAEQWGGWAGYKVRLLPILAWIFLVAAQALILTAIYKKKISTGTSLKDTLTAGGLLKSWGIVIGILAVCVLIVAFFRIGLIPDIVYWNDTNVPLLGVQVCGAVAGSVIFLGLLENLGFFRINKLSIVRKKFDFPTLVLCLLLWGLTVVVWTQIEMPHSYFSPGPYPPNGEMYPFSDAEGYDTASQFAAIGEGLGTQTYIDKPLYVAFLTIIHLLVGSRMDAVVGLQVAVIALLPVVIFLLGMKLHSRSAGLLAAGFVIFREVNNIQGTLWVLSTNSRVLMSESLVTLLLAASVFFLAVWFQSTTKTHYLLASGGSLGLAALVRLNPFLLLPFAMIAVFLICWKKWRQAVVNTLLFGLIFLVAILPWTIQSWVVHDNLLFFRSTLNGVVLGQRTFYSLNQPVPKPDDTNEIQPTPTAPVQPVNRTWNRVTGISRYVSAHFFHNLISAMSIFPSSLQMDSLETVIKSPDSFWSPDWSGELTTGQSILVGMNLLIIGLGIAAAWSRRKWAGLIPAGFLVVYSLATSIARTSGGRYILPADWVALFYFALGITQLLFWISHLTGIREYRIKDEVSFLENGGITSRWRMAGVIFLILFLGAFPVILDRVIPKRYTNSEKPALVLELENKNILPSLGITKSELDAFLLKADAVIYSGRGLYPRFYAINQGEPDRFSATRGQPFSRLVMDIIGPHKMASGVLPMESSPELLPNGADVLAIGCRGKLNDDWLALVVFSPEIHVYLRNPSTQWVCPIQLPVCDDNRNCR